MTETIKRLIEVETDADQAWFWSETWQAMEREADRELAAGIGTIDESGEAFLAALRTEHERLRAEGC